MKKFMMFLGVISILIVTGCDISEYGNKVDNFLKDNNSAVSSTENRSVEGHIQNMDYALLQEEMKGNAGKFNNLTTYEEIVNALNNDGINLPANDNIRCETYNISKVTVGKATKCADLGDKADKNQWNGRTYTYTKGGTTQRDDD